MAYRGSIRTAALSLLLLFHADYTPAADARGQIMKSSGEVYIVDPQGVERKFDDTKPELHEMDTVVTREGGKAVVQFDDGALSVLDEKSKLRIEKGSWLSHLGGKIYFTFRKVFGEPRKVNTPFSTIGVRGTTFIVYADASGEGVALQEGQLEIESPGDEYELHITRELNEFELYKQQAEQKNEEMRREFDSYKKQINREFVEYRKSFTLQANQVIRFSGQRVDQTSLDAVENSAVSAEFGSFEQEAGELLLKFRAQAKQQRETQQQKQKKERDDF